MEAAAAPYDIGSVIAFQQASLEELQVSVGEVEKA